MCILGRVVIDKCKLRTGVIVKFPVTPGNKPIVITSVKDDG